MRQLMCGKIEIYFALSWRVSLLHTLHDNAAEAKMSAGAARRYTTVRFMPHFSPMTPRPPA